MSVYDPSWKPHDGAPSRLGRMALLGFMILLIVLWMSHSSLSAKIPAESSTVEPVTPQLEAVQSQVEQIRSVVREHSKDILTIKMGEVERTPGVVALNNPEAQLIGRGFAVTRLEVESLGQGLFVQGRVINLQAVKHDDLVFRLSAGEESVEFPIDRLEAGESRPFSAFLPTRTFAETLYARIDYLESTIFHRALE